MKPLIFRRGKRIIVKDYESRREELEEFCRKHMVGYETKSNGTAVIVCD